MAGEIIRMGDRTTHGGTVIEGSYTDICMGKPIAFIGHMTQCPQCKGTYPIVEGVPTTTFYGKGVALAGMKTACGALLVAGQFTDTVEWNPGAHPPGQVHANAVAAKEPTGAGLRANTAPPQGAYDDDDVDVEIEHFYALSDEDGMPVDAYHYDVHAADERLTNAGPYKNGETVTISGNEPTRLVTWLNTDGALRA